MTKEELLQLISEGEDQKVEFKRTFNHQALIAINAMSNSTGGFIILGVADGGAITGLTLNKESLQNWLNEIKQKFEPQIIPELFLFKINSQNIVVIKVDSYPVKPVGLQGRYYQRHNNANHILSLARIAELHLQSLQLSWDSYAFPNKTMHDLDDQKIEAFISEINNTGRFSSSSDKWLVLNKLSLIKNNKPTTAAILLFAKIPERNHIRIGRFKSASTIIDDRQITDTLFEAAEESLKFIKSYIQLEYIFEGNIKRKERWEYPVEAIKESLLNAIVHRDYKETNDIQIKVFDDKITIFSPGKLYGNLTVEDILNNNYQSSLRNKLVAEAFYLSGEIEKYGTGFMRIKDYLKEYPEITFRFEEVHNGILVSYEKTAQKTAQKSTRDEIVKLLHKNPFYTKEDLMRILQKADGTIKEHLARLKKEGKISRKGGRKDGYWEVIE